MLIFSVTTSTWATLKNFQPIRDPSFNKEMGVRTSPKTVQFFEWLVSILNFSRLEWLTLSVSQSQTKETCFLFSHDQTFAFLKVKE